MQICRLLLRIDTPVRSMTDIGVQEDQRDRDERGDYRYPDEPLVSDDVIEALVPEHIHPAP